MIEIVVNKEIGCLEEQGVTFELGYNPLLRDWCVDAKGYECLYVKDIDGTMNYYNDEDSYVPDLSITVKDCGTWFFKKEV